MYMHKNKKIIIICKFNLKNKCKFRHLNVSELNDILNKFKSLKNENESLKLDLKEKYQKISNLKKSMVTSQILKKHHRSRFITVFLKKK